MSYASKKAARQRTRERVQQEEEVALAALDVGYNPWTPPFRYDDVGCWIEDANGKRLLDLRGWGYLTGTGYGGLKLNQERAASIQDRIGRRVVELLNADAGRAVGTAGTVA